MKLLPYPAYKPSGVEWLGDVPEHWEVVAYKRNCNRVEVGIAEAATHAYCDEGVPIIRSTNVKPNRLDVSDVLRIEPWFAAKNRSKTLRAGDLVTVRTGYPGTTAVVPVEFDGCQCFTLVMSSPKRDAHGPFFSWVLNSHAGVSYFEMEGWGTAQTNISVPIVQFIPVPRPPPVEQRAIAAFLARETGRVDRLVAKKRELIERLKEKRTALISRTVTRGLPPDAARAAGLPENPPLKPSALDWLGDIPEHWRVMRFRRLITRLEQGWSPNANNCPAGADELGVLKLGAASKGKFYPEDNKALDDIPEGLVPITPASGDLLISRANTPDLVGDACVVKGNYPNRIIPDLLYRLRLRADTNGDFVCWFLLSRLGRAQVECDARGSSGSMVKLGQGHVRAWSIPFPPLPEQAAIATYLDVETAKLDALVGKVEEAVERLQEYRTALITAAVTGKIDVRGTELSQAA